MGGQRIRDAAFFNSLGLAPSIVAECGEDGELADEESEPAREDAGSASGEFVFGWEETQP